MMIGEFATFVAAISVVISSNASVYNQPVIFIDGNRESDTNRLKGIIKLMLFRGKYKSVVSKINRLKRCREFLFVAKIDLSCNDWRYLFCIVYDCH